MNRIQQINKQLGIRRKVISYWEKDIPQLQNSFDVVVVGAGLAGLWTAYFIQKKFKGVRLAIFESDRFSLGASTRNAGFITCGNISQLQDDSKYVGKQKAIEMMLERAKGVALIRKQLPNFKIRDSTTIDYDEVTDSKKKLIAEVNNYFVKNKFQPPFKLIQSSLGQQAKRTCVVNQLDGCCNPVELLNQLRTLLISNGKAAFINQKVRTCAKGKLTTQKQTYSYKRGFICVNAFASQLTQQKANVVPGRGQIIVSSPVAKPGTANGTMNRGYDYWRWIDGRLLIGGGRNLTPASQVTYQLQQKGTLIKSHLESLMAKILEGQKYEVQYHWAGLMGFENGQHGPIKIFKVDEQTTNVFSCSGMGVALTPLAGREASSGLTNLQ